MAKKTIGYQIVSKDDTHIPNGLYSFQIFRSVQAAQNWLGRHGERMKDWKIIGFSEGDIEDPIYVDPSFLDQQ